MWSTEPKSFTYKPNNFQTQRFLAIAVGFVKINLQGENKYQIPLPELDMQKSGHLACLLKRRKPQ